MPPQLHLRSRRSSEATLRDHVDVAAEATEKARQWAWLPNNPAIAPLAWNVFTRPTFYCLETPQKKTARPLIITRQRPERRGAAFSHEKPRHFYRNLEVNEIRITRRSIIGLRTPVDLAITYVSADIAASSFASA